MSGSACYPWTKLNPLTKPRKSVMKSPVVAPAPVFRAHSAVCRALVDNQDQCRDVQPSWTGPIILPTRVWRTSPSVAWRAPTARISPVFSRRPPGGRAQSIADTSGVGYSSQPPSRPSTRVARCPGRCAVGAGRVPLRLRGLLRPVR
jgi:hypothetical protein